jgi:hypothetical protein
MKERNPKMQFDMFVFLKSISQNNLKRETNLDLLSCTKAMKNGDGDDTRI